MEIEEEDLLDGSYAFLKDRKCYLNNLYNAIKKNIASENMESDYLMYLAKDISYFKFRSHAFECILGLNSALRVHQESDESDDDMNTMRNSQ